MMEQRSNVGAPMPSTGGGAAPTNDETESDTTDAEDDNETAETEETTETA